MRKSIAAGILIGLASYANIGVENTYIGALLFCFALMSICQLNLNLYTGKVAYIQIGNIIELLKIWLGNVIGVVIFSFIIRVVINPNLVIKARLLIDTKLSYTFSHLCYSSLVCGVIIFLVTYIFKYYNGNISSIVTLVIGVSLFVLCKFDHCIADFSYIMLSYNFGDNIADKLKLIVITSLYNGIGAVGMRYLIMQK